MRPDDDNDWGWGAIFILALVCGLVAIAYLMGGAQ